MGDVSKAHEYAVSCIKGGDSIDHAIETACFVWGVSERRLRDFIEIFPLTD